MGSCSSQWRDAMVEVVLGVLVMALLCGGLAGASIVGVCYGRQGNNLPSPQQTVQLLVAQGITKVRLFSADSDVLQALGGTQIEVIVGIPNAQIPTLGQSQAAASDWVKRNIATYVSSTNIIAVAVGSEVLTSAEDDDAYLVPAMQNIFDALQQGGLDKQVKVSSPHAMGVLANSFPPSSASFDTRFSSVIQPMLSFLSNTGSFFMINAYPYYAYRNGMRYTSLDFALLKQQSSSGFTDPNSGLQYTNLFDAQVDAVFYALAAMNYRSMAVVVSETGWPSMGDASETNIVNMQNAATYNNNLMRVVLDGNGTPFRPGQNIDVYIFELFNENQRSGPTSNRNWGLFRPDGSKLYSISFAGGSSGGSSGGNNPAIIELNRTFCVAASGANFNTLQSSMDWACGPGHVDCRPVQPGGRCYQPDTVASHASFVFNSYYQMNGMDPSACSFSGSSVVTIVDPSYRSCVYAGSLKYSGATSSIEQRWVQMLFQILLAACLPILLPLILW